MIEIINIDMETGDLDEFDSTVSDGGNLAASSVEVIMNTVNLKDLHGACLVIDPNGLAVRIEITPAGLVYVQATDDDD